MYENAYSSCYGELQTYYPVWYREVKEMDAIWKVMGGELDDIQSGIVQFVLNAYIQTANEETLTRWENFLWITYDGERTLAERRNMILQFFNGFGHIGADEIIEIVNAFTTGQVQVDLIDGEVQISVTRDLAERFILSDCILILNKRMPAHLGIMFNDILLPISFYTNNHFRFMWMQFESSFYNFGTDVILLDGRQLLDASWRLNQFLGYRFLMDECKVRLEFRTKRKETKMPLMHIGILNFLQHESNQLLSIGMKCSFFCPVHCMSHQQMEIAISTQYRSALKGFVMIDSMYLLDGSIQLDGSRKLNAAYEKEEL